MNHHTNKQYLLENIRIVNHFLSTKEGIVITYVYEGKTFFMIADPERLAGLLMDCNMIQDRRNSASALYIKINDAWRPFEYYLPSFYNDADLILLCARHEESKCIEAITDTYMAARMKPLNYN